MVEKVNQVKDLFQDTALPVDERLIFRKLLENVETLLEYWVVNAFMLEEMLLAVVGELGFDALTDSFGHFQKVMWVDRFVVIVEKLNYELEYLLSGCVLDHVIDIVQYLLGNSLLEGSH